MSPSTRRPLGLKASQDIVAAHPDVSVIVSADQAITGAVTAVKDIKDKVRLVGYGGGAIALQGIALGRALRNGHADARDRGRPGHDAAHPGDPDQDPGPGVDPLATLPDGGVVTKANVDTSCRSRSGRADHRRASADADGHRGQRRSPHLEVRGIGKSFGATRALDDVSVAVRSGSVHAFVGENGAGKSTLGKIIAGVFPQDQGDLVLRGTTVSFRSPREALDRGIALVAQEVALVPRLTVAENVFLGAEPRRAGFIDRRPLRDRFDRLAADAGFDLRADSIVGRLPLAQQQQVEILRALARDADLIVLDEPSASLSAKEVERLHEVVRGLRARGHTVILVSHFLGEVLDLSDVVTVLRDGRVVRTDPTADETEKSLVTGMLGRPVGRAYPAKRPPPPDAPVALSIEGLSRRRASSDVSLTLRAGEIVGLAGLVGAGRSELARAIFGASPLTAGQVQVRGRRSADGRRRRSRRASR